MTSTNCVTEHEAQQTLAELYALLATCFEHPSEPFYEATQTGQFTTEVRTRLEHLGIDFEPVPSVEMSHSDLRKAYLRTFEGFNGPSVPPVESVHEPWWDGKERKLLSGPAEADVERRFDATGLEIPNQYPADHLTVLLEYASLILEAGHLDAYADFHAHHFDWLEVFTKRVEDVDSEPLYRWAAATTAQVVASAGTRFVDSGDS